MNLHKHQPYLLKQHSESFKYGQQLLGLALKVNPWLWNWAQTYKWQRYRYVDRFCSKDPN